MQVLPSRRETPETELIFDFRLAMDGVIDYMLDGATMRVMRDLSEMAGTVSS